MKRTHLLAVLTPLMAASAMHMGARTLSPEAALSRALPSVSAMSLDRNENAPPQLVYTQKDRADLPAVYVFSYGTTGGGFLVLPASDAVTHPILGYSDSGTFSASDMPPAMRWWLKQYAAEVSAADASGVNEEAPSESGQERTDIAPLVQTYWNQTTPYWNLTPVVNGTHCPTGCVATAMAQVMNFWQYPAQGIGSNSYYPSSAVGETLSLDFSQITFDWDAMLERYNAQSPQESIDAVSTLMYACGVGVNMNYAPGESGSNYTQATNALVNYFGYDIGIRDLSRNYFELPEWVDMIYSELAAGRPVLYGGLNDDGGHAFVCDGYRTDGYFHINWGWGGVSNGYFLITALNPTQQGVGGSTGGYNLNQTMVIGIQPPVAGSEYRPVIEFSSDFTLGYDTYTRAAGSAATVSDTRGIFNMSLSNIDLVFGLRLIDSISGDTTYVRAIDTVNLPKGAGIRSYSLYTDMFPSQGSYTVEPVVRHADSDNWYECLVRMTNIRQYRLQCTADSLYFEPIDPAKITQKTLQLESPLHPMQTCLVSSILSNDTDEEYYRQVMPVLIQGGYEVSSGDAVAVELLPGQEALFEWEGPFSGNLTPGAYTMYLVDNAGKKIGAGVNVTMTATPSGMTSASVPSVTIGGVQSVGNTPDTPALCDLEHFTTTMTVRCTGGYYAQQVNGAVWYSTAQGVTGLGGKFVALDAGDQTDITVNHDLSDLDPNHVYLLYVKGVDSGAIAPPVYFKASPTSGITVVDGPGEPTAYTDGETLIIGGVENFSGAAVYDSQGRKVLVITAPTASVAHLPHGVYVVRAAGVDTPMKFSK